MRDRAVNEKRIDEPYEEYLKATEDKQAAATLVLARVIADTDFAHDVTYGINQSRLAKP